MPRHKPVLSLSKGSMSAVACTTCAARGQWPLRAPFECLRVTAITRSIDYLPSAVVKSNSPCRENNKKGCHAEAQACPEFIEGKHERSGLYDLLSTRTLILFPN